MLVQFRLKNFLSFKDEAVLDMRAVNAYKEHLENTVDLAAKDRLLRVLSIYGANASGKSNLVLAFQNFLKLVKESSNNADEFDKKAIERYYKPFSFVTKESQSPTEFEITIILDDIEYRYGFEYTKKEIIEEWLYIKKLETNRNTIIFERSRGAIDFGASVKRACQAYEKQIPQDALVLSFFHRLNLKTDVFRALFKGLSAIIVLDSDISDFSNLLMLIPEEILKNKKNKAKFLDYLKAIDTGIVDISSFTNFRGEDTILTYHRADDGELYPLNLFRESEGTLKSMNLYLISNFIIDVESTLIVDELNVKLHPLLLKFIVDLFYENEARAQLIYTTHDTTLMDKKFFRRDQICFVDKNEFGLSNLVALSDFRVRSDASFEKDYLAGVYGGIPMLKAFSIEDLKNDRCTPTSKRVGTETGSSI